MSTKVLYIFKFVVMASLIFVMSSCSKPQTVENSGDYSFSFSIVNDGGLADQSGDWVVIE